MSEAPSLELLVEVGNPGFYPGLAQVKLEGTGDVTARQTFAVAGEAVEALAIGDEQWGTGPGVVRGRIDPARAAGLLEQTAAFPWDRAFPTRPGIPDEAIVVIRFGPRGGPHRTLRLWLRQAEDDPGVGAVLRELRTMLSELPGSAIVL